MYITYWRLRGESFSDPNREIDFGFGSCRACRACGRAGEAKLRGSVRAAMIPPKVRAAGRICEAGASWRRRCSAGSGWVPGGFRVGSGSGWVPGGFRFRVGSE